MVEWLCVSGKKEDRGCICVRVWVNVFICVKDVIHGLQENWNCFRLFFCMCMQLKANKELKIKMSYDETHFHFHMLCLYTNICIPNRMFYESLLMMIVAQFLCKSRFHRSRHIFFLFRPLGSKCLHLALHFN